MSETLRAFFAYAWGSYTSLRRRRGPHERPSLDRDHCICFNLKWHNESRTRSPARAGGAATLCPGGAHA